MDEYKNKFITFLLNTGALSFGSFVTKSGRKSPYFINTGKFNSGILISELGFYYASAIQKSKVEFDTVFGPAYKGIPLAISTCISLSRDFNKNYPYAFNRKETKDHGESGLIVGDDFTKPKKLLLVDDVITAGTAIREIKELLFKNFPLVRIQGIVISVDRQERGKGDISGLKEISNDLGIKVFSVITISEVLEFIRSDKNLSIKYLNTEIEKSIEEYQKLYGAVE